MARTDSLGNFLADIAAVIKEKKGATSPISAKDFDTEIEEVVEIAKEDYKTLDNDGIHLSTKYTNWQEEIEKKENEIVHMPAGISPEKTYAPLDPSYTFTKVKLRYDSLKIEQQSRGEHCMFTSDSDLNEVEIWSGSTSMTVKALSQEHIYLIMNGTATLNNIIYQIQLERCIIIDFQIN